MSVESILYSITASVEAQLFDFESVIANAVVNAFTNAGFAASAYTGQTPPELQRKRPRVEVQFKQGGMEVPIRQLNDGTYRPQAFHGELMVAAITDVTGTAKQTHGDYRGKVRSFCYTLLPRVNNSAKVQGGLQYHKILSAIESGTTLGFNPEKGEETSVISFRVQFCINSQGFALLASPQVDTTT